MQPEVKRGWQQLTPYVHPIRVAATHPKVGTAMREAVTHPKLGNAVRVAATHPKLGNAMRVAATHPSNNTQWYENGSHTLPSNKGGNTSE